VWEGCVLGFESSVFACAHHAISSCQVRISSHPSGHGLDKPAARGTEPGLDGRAWGCCFVAPGAGQGRWLAVLPRGQARAPSCLTPPFTEGLDGGAERTRSRAADGTRRGGAAPARGSCRHPRGPGQPGETGWP